MGYGVNEGTSHNMNSYFYSRLFSFKLFKERKKSYA